MRRNMSASNCCMNCTAGCFGGVIGAVVGDHIDVEELFWIVLGKKAFYQAADDGFFVPGGDEDDFMLNAVTRLEDGRCFLFSADDDFMQSYVSKQRFMAVL